MTIWTFWVGKFGSVVRCATEEDAKQLRALILERWPKADCREIQEEQLADSKTFFKED